MLHYSVPYEGSSHKFPKGHPVVWFRLVCAYRQIVLHNFKVESKLLCIFPIIYNLLFHTTLYPKALNILSDTGRFPSFRLVHVTRHLSILAFHVFLARKKDFVMPCVRELLNWLWTLRYDSMCLRSLQVDSRRTLYLSHRTAALQ